MKKLIYLIRSSKKLITGIFWVGLGSVLSSVSVYICSLIVSRFLGIQIYGKYSIIQANVYTFSNIASAGLGITVTKFVAEYRDFDKKKCGDVISTCKFISLITSIFFALIIFTSSSYYATYILKDKTIIGLLRIASLYVLFTTMNANQIGALAGLELFNKVAYLNLFQGIFNIVTMLIFTYLFGITGSVLALSFSSFLLWFYNYVILKKVYKEKQIIIDTSKLMIDKSITYNFLFPAALCGIVSGVMTWGSTNLIATLKNGYTELAMYNAANSYKIIILYIPNLIGRVIMPALSNSKGGNRVKQYHILVKVNFIVNILISSFIGIFVITNSRFFFRIYGKDFYNNNILMTVIVIGAFFDVIINLILQLLVVNNKMWSQLLVIIIRYLSLIIITYILRDELGGLALGLGYMASTIINFIYYIIYYLIKYEKGR